MSWIRSRAAAVALGAAAGLPASLAAAGAAGPGPVHPGVPLERGAGAAGCVEDLDEAIERDLARRAIEQEAGHRPGAEPAPRHGRWVIPPRRAARSAHSGRRYVSNQWGDTRMAIGFPRAVDVQGAYIAGQGGRGVWAQSLRVTGYRDGVEVARTAAFTDVDEHPDFFAMNLRDVDRIVIEAAATLGGAGWYALDDLRYTIPAGGGPGGGRPVVVDFEDARFREEITGSGYAGLRWETGTGTVLRGHDGAVEQPLVPPGTARDLGAAAALEAPGGGAAEASRVTLPELLADFPGVIRGDAGSFAFPPDTNGAIGPRHFVIAINRNFAVFDRESGAVLADLRLDSFLPGSNGDPRVLFDHFSGRWIVIVTDFSGGANVFIAVSRTDDPTGAWFKDSFHTAEGPDGGCWPDYPTLGYDETGVYVAAFMVNCNSMTVWAMEKAPMIAETPRLGVITAFRGLPFEGAIQPLTTYGDSGGEYLVSRQNSTTLRVRQISGDIRSPSLVERGGAVIPSHAGPPDVPALGSATPLDHTVGHRILNALYRNGSIWACHDVGLNGRSACRFYEIDAATLALLQVGTAQHPQLHYFYGSIAVNAENDLVMGFSGSSPEQFAGCYYTGRAHTDLPNKLAIPVEYKEGTGPQNNIDGIGRNRWGDYSLTSVDPADDFGLWTVQEYGRTADIWGTWIAQLDASAPLPGDVDDDGMVNFQDILLLLAAWGDCPDPPDPCPADLDGDGTVGFADLLIVLGNWTG